MSRGVDSKIHRAFGPIRRRLTAQHLIHGVIWGSIAAIGQGILWMGVSFLIPIIHIKSIMAYTGGIVMAITFLVSWVTRPSISKMTKKADKLGFEERITTAYELSHRDDQFAKAQRHDTLNRLKAFDPKNIDITTSKKSSLIAMGLLMLLMSGFFIPNPQDGIIKKRLHAEKVIEEQLKRLEDESNKELAMEAGLTPKEREEIKKLLARLTDKLKKTRDHREALKEISKTQEEIIELAKETKRQEMADLGEELSRQEALRSLGEQIKEMDTEGIKEEMGRLQELAKNGGMDKDAMDAVKDALEQMADKLGKGKIQDRLMELAGDIGKNLDKDTMDLAEELGVLEDLLMDLAGGPLSETQDLMYALQDMKNKISKAGSVDIDKSQLAQSNGPDNQEGDSGNSNADQGNSQGNIEEPGQGQGSQGGQQGQGSQSGQQGQGNQSGQGQGGQGGSDSNSAGGGQGAGIGTAHPEYERILDPKRLGDGGEVSQVKGNINEQGSGQQIETGQGLGDFDGFVPYDEVFGEYKNQAMRNIERMSIPPNMREWIKSYFTALE